MLERAKDKAPSSRRLVDHLLGPVLSLLRYPRGVLRRINWAADGETSLSLCYWAQRVQPKHGGIYRPPSQSQLMSPPMT